MQRGNYNKYPLLFTFYRFMCPYCTHIYPLSLADSTILLTLSMEKSGSLINKIINKIIEKNLWSV